MSKSNENVLGWVALAAVGIYLFKNKQKVAQPITLPSQSATIQASTNPANGANGTAAIINQAAPLLITTIKDIFGAKPPIITTAPATVNTGTSPILPVDQPAPGSSAIYYNDNFDDQGFLKDSYPCGGGCGQSMGCLPPAILSGLISGEI